MTEAAISVTSETADPPETDVRPLGWWRFALQLVTVMAAYLASSVPPILIWGQTSVALALSVLTSMIGGLLVAWLWLRSDRALGEAFNLARPQSWPRALGVAAAATVAIILIFSVGGWLLEQVGLPTPNVDLIMGMVTQSPLMLLLWIVVVAWAAAGFGEELLWRGFLMDRLLRLNGLAGRIWPVIVIQALLFGLPHLYQGMGGVLLTGTVGLLFGWLRVKCNWNLWPLIIAHGLVDTIMLSLGYAEAHDMLPAFLTEAN